MNLKDESKRTYAETGLWEEYTLGGVYTVYLP